MSDRVPLMKLMAALLMGYEHENERDRLVADHMAEMHRVINLPKNVEKGSWANLTRRDLSILWDREVEEFKEALKDYLKGVGSIEHLRSEAADVSICSEFVIQFCEKIEAEKKVLASLPQHGKIEP